MKHHTRRVSARRQRLTYVVTDWVTANVAFLCFNVVRYLLLGGVADSDHLFLFLDSTKLLVEQVIVPVVMLGIYWLSGYYNLPFGKSRLQELVTTLSSSAVNTGLIYLALLTNDQIIQRSINWLLIILLFFILTLFTYTGRLTLTSRSRRRFIAHDWGIRTVIIGNSLEAQRVARRLAGSQSAFGYHVAAMVSIPGESTDPHPVDGVPVIGYDDFLDRVREIAPDQIIIVPERRDDQGVLKHLYRLFPLDIPIRIAPDNLSFITQSIRLQDIYGEPFVDLSSPVITQSDKNIKRLSDIFLSALAMVLLAPVYAALALWVKLDSPGPVFYKQERVGYHRRPFNIVKFRSMVTDAEAAGPQLSSDDDPRITRAGRIMRKYRLDELPQFWNVLRGDMSLVGPRPERAHFVRHIIERAPYYGLVHQVRPGITSWGMVKYGYASSVEEMIRRARFDLIYLSNMSVSVDLKILIHTIKTVVTGKGK